MAVQDGGRGHLLDGIVGKRRHDIGKFVRTVSFAAGLAASFACAAFCGETFISVTPSIIERTLSASRALKGKIVLQNPKPVTVMVTPEIQDWWTERTGLQIPPAREWLTLSKTKPIKMGPLEKATVKYELKFPKGFSGELMAMIFFNMKTNETGSNGGPIRVELRHGIPIYAATEGFHETQAEIEKVSAQFDGGVSTGPIEFMVSVKNTGKVHFRPKGYVTVKGADFKDESELDWGWPLLPQGKHSYFGKTKKTNWEPGRYETLLKLDIGQPFYANLYKEKTVALEISPEKKIEVKVEP